ncbi:MAG: Flp family type IVb pilin [Gammaproteobacteria bacterium]|nr:Flp family type IVb pilin [Gammaproteobacteria bacterium]
MSGVSTVEYALILVAVIAIVAAGGAMLGTDFDTLFTNIGADITAAEAGLKTPGNDAN